MASRIFPESKDSWKGWRSEFKTSRALSKLMEEKVISDFFWVPQFSFLDHLRIDFILLIDHSPFFLYPLQVKSSYEGLLEHKSKMIKQQGKKLEEARGRIYYIKDGNLVELIKKKNRSYAQMSKTASVVSVFNERDICPLDELMNRADNQKRIFLIIKGKFYELVRGLLLNIPVVCVYETDSEKELSDKIKKIIKNYCLD